MWHAIAYLEAMLAVTEKAPKERAPERGSEKSSIGSYTFGCWDCE